MLLLLFVVGEFLWGGDGDSWNKFYGDQITNFKKKKQAEVISKKITAVSKQVQEAVDFHQEVAQHLQQKTARKRPPLHHNTTPRVLISRAGSSRTSKTNQPLSPASPQQLMERSLPVSPQLLIERSKTKRLPASPQLIER